MYSSLSNHLVNILHYLVAFIILFIIYPQNSFKRIYETSLESLVSNYIIMVFLTIIMGYFLVVTKLFEFIGIAIFLLSVTIYTNFFRGDPRFIYERTLKFTLLIYDYLDRKRSFKADSKNLLRKTINNYRDKLLNKFQSKINLCNFILLTGCLLSSTYLRVYDTFINAAPAMSDSYITLKWMKDIINRTLFDGGIYPRGFHIYMATLQKFAFIDPLYILRYSGALSGVLTSLGMYFVASRITKNKTSGVISVILFGILVNILIGAGNAERQAAANSQEFAFIFVMPTLYFFSKYLLTHNRRDFFTAFSGAAVAGLIHTISFVFIALGVFIMLILAAIIDVKKNRTAIYKIILAGVASSIISVIPVGLGFILGATFHSTSEDFLTQSSNTIVIRQLTGIDKIGLASLAVIFIYLLFNYKNIKEDFSQVSMFFIAIAAFLTYYVGGYLTKSVVVDTRMADFWSLTKPVIIGMALNSVVCVFRNFRLRNISALAGGISFAIFSIFYIKPAPIIPYKMEHNSNIEQYFRLSESLNPTEWMIVSQNEGYAVSIGKGYHILMEDFLKYYDPEFYDESNPYLFYKKDSSYTKTQDIFLFQEKKVFTTQFTDIVDYPLRERQNKELQQWIEKYRLNHSNLSIYHEDNDIVVYRIHQGMSREEILKRLWDGQ